MQINKILSVLLCLIFMWIFIPAGSVRAENSFTYDGITISGDITANDITYDIGRHLILGKYGEGGTYHVTLSGTAPDGHYFSVRNNVTAYITLEDLHLTGDIATFNVNSGATVVIYLKGSNTLIGKSGSGLSVNYNAILNIDQAPALPGENPEEIKGFLYVSAGGGYPGIKAARKDWVDGNFSYPTLNIRGGTITAIGSRQAAGIGGGNGETGGKINIYGGVVTAIGNRGAGIGGGNYSENGGQIYISGGIVNATSPEAGAGIGGGDDGSDGGNIYIAGGLVTAVGAGAAAGIGGGNDGTSGDITITGGHVIAAGNGGGAGIGGGLHSNNEGGSVENIRLYGGTIFARGSDGGEDIGKGSGGTDNGSIAIADFPAVSNGIPTAVFLRNDTPVAPTHIDSAFSHVGPYNYEGISKYGFHLSDFYPDSLPDITTTLPEGVTGPGDYWLRDFWTNQLNLWNEADNAGAYIQPRTVNYHNIDDLKEINKTQHRGTYGKIMDGSIFTRPGYGFIMWTTSPNGGSQYTPGDRYTFNNNLDLYANWDIIRYQINYDLKGGTVGHPNPEDYTVNSGEITLNNPVKPGYTFDGWTGTGITGTVLNVTIGAGSTGTRSYTANWSPNTYTVSYDANGGVGTMHDTIFTYDREYNLSANAFTRKGYTFVGWSMVPGDNVVYSDGERVKNIVEEGNIILYANWTMNNYNIDYNLDGGTVMPDNQDNYSIESSDITLTNPVKEGYIFTGWSGTGITGTLMNVTIPKGSVGNRSYKANWIVNPPGYLYRTLTERDTGITVSGMIREDAVLMVGDLSFGSDSGCESIRSQMNNPDLVFILGKDISLTQDFIGTLTITIPIDNGYNGKAITVTHCVNGKAHTYTVNVYHGSVTFDVTDLSPFALFAATEQGDGNNENGGSDKNNNIPITGDGSQPLLWILIGVLAAGVTGLIVLRDKRKDI